MNHSFEPTTLRTVIKRILGGGTPSRAVDAFWGGDIPWASVKDFSDSKSVINDTREHITEKGLSNSAANLIEPNTVLVCTRMAIGRAALCTQHLAINQDLKALYPNEKVSAEYLLLLLKQHRPYLESMAIGSTVKGLSVDQLLDLQIDLPFRQEQIKIAAVSSCIDTTIEQSEALIAKQQRIKTGLMQDLLTKGIDENGDIRSEETHRFDNSSVGKIATEWKADSLESLLKTPLRDFGSFSSTKEITFLEGGIPFLKSEMVRAGAIDWSGCFYISEDVHKKLRKSHVKKGDILFSKIGSALGKAAVYEGERGECNSNAAIAKIDINEAKANRYFVEYVLNFDTTQRQLKNMIVSLLPRVNLGDINKIQVPIPPVPEQERIVCILKSLDEAIVSTRVYSSKLQRLKKGLMQDLLAGTVSVERLLTKDA